MISSAPEFQKDWFTCPYCMKHARMSWSLVHRESDVPGIGEPRDLHIASCWLCRKYSVWYDGKLIQPQAPAVEPPNPDLAEDIQKDYLEAASIHAASPRGAAALLRLCVQKLCTQLGQPGKNLDEDIGSLVKNGLSVQIQQALDILRVTGNQAVHPGEMQLDDDAETARSLFVYINLIAESLISQPKRIQEQYQKLPQAKLEAIEKRDRL